MCGSDAYRYRGMGAGAFRATGLNRSGRKTVMLISVLRKNGIARTVAVNQPREGLRVEQAVAERPYAEVGDQEESHGRRQPGARHARPGPPFPQGESRGRHERERQIDQRLMGVRRPVDTAGQDQDSQIAHQPGGERCPVRPSSRGQRTLRRRCRSGGSGKSSTDRWSCRGRSTSRTAPAGRAPAACRRSGQGSPESRKAGVSSLLPPLLWFPDR